MPAKPLAMYCLAIIIDEEHESTYKQESAPRYHARDVAAWMAQRTGAALVLGSATPSIETLCRCKVDDMWHRVVLPTRANGKPMPEVRIIDMAKEFGRGSRSMFAKELQENLFAAVDAGRKVVLMPISVDSRTSCCVAIAAMCPNALRARFR